MSLKLGSTYQLNLLSASLGAATGRVMPLANNGWIVFISAALRIQTTITAGNRGFVFQFKDSNGNIIHQSFNTTTQAANIIWTYIIGAMQTVANNAILFIPVPEGLILPPFSSLTVVDTLNFDINDTVLSPSIILSV